MTRPQSTPAVRESRRKQILKSAQAEFAAKGYHGTEVASIAKRAGVSKGTIYNYFDDKESLLMGVVRAGFDRISELMRELSAGATDPIDTISDAIRNYLEFFDRNRAFVKVLVKEAVQILPRVRTEYREHFVVHVSHLERLIRKGIASKRLVNVDARLAALCLFEMVGAVTKGAIVINRKLDVDKDHKTIMRIFLNGIERK